MDEKTFRSTLEVGKALLCLCQAFPASEIKEYVELHYPDDTDLRFLASQLWAVHVEGGV
jgi:hypothetical protein